MITYPQHPFLFLMTITDVNYSNVNKYTAMQSSTLVLKQNKNND